MYEYETGVHSDDGWTLYGGLTPQRVRQWLDALQERRDRAYETRETERKLAQARADEAVQPRLELFRDLLGKVGITPPQHAQLHHISYDGSHVEITYDLVRIPEAKEYDHIFGRTQTRPGRILTAVLSDDEQLHLQVTGRPQNRADHGPTQTWDAGPLRCEEDLARAIDKRGDIHWTPPAPAPVPEPDPEPTAAEIARDLLDELAAEPLNRQGPRGIALAQAYATLAAAETSTPLTSG